MTRKGSQFCFSAYPSSLSVVCFCVFLVSKGLQLTSSPEVSMGRDLHIERWVAGGCSGGLEFQSDQETADMMTYAERIQIGELVINAAGVRERNRHVKAIIPLFCNSFRDKFLRLYIQKVVQTSQKKLF